MKRILSNHPIPFLCALGLGVISTLASDFSADIRVPNGSRGEAALYWVSLLFRVLTFSVFFASFPMLARRVAQAPRRSVTVFWAWFLPSLGLVLLVWGLLAWGDALYTTPVLKRITPDTMATALFAQGHRQAELTLFPWREAIYTWPVAIGAEVLALMVITSVLAEFVRRAAEQNRIWRAWFTPALGGLLLVVYAMAVGWALDFDVDIFIGDALLGAALYNALYVRGTLIAGGFTAPAVWVGVIAATNVWLIMVWDRARA